MQHKHFLLGVWVQKTLFDYTLSICSSPLQRDVDSKEAEQLTGINQIVYLLRVPCRVQQHIIIEGKLSKQARGRQGNRL